MHDDGGAVVASEKEIRALFEIGRVVDETAARDHHLGPGLGVPGDEQGRPASFESESL